MRLALLVLVTACWSGPPPETVSNTRSPARQIAGGDRIPNTGNPAARVKLVSYHNYRCPHCLHFEPILAALVDHYKDRIFVEYRTLRLGHWPDADLAAAAALAAHRQGKFVAMHRRLSGAAMRALDATTLAPGDPVFDTASLEDHARAIGLDVPRFLRDLEDPALRARVDRDTTDAEAAEIGFVPYLIINGKPYEDVLDREHLAARIDRLLAD